MKGSYGLSYLSLFFCVIIFSISVWLIRASNMNKKGIGFFSHSRFLEHLCLPSAFKVSSVFELKACLPPAIRTPLTWSSISHAYLLLVMSVAELLCIMGAPEFCAHEVLWTLCANAVEERVYCTLSPLIPWMFHCPIRFHLTVHI